MKRVQYYILAMAIICLGSKLTSAQTLTISGTVTDESTNEAVPFANVFVPGSTSGVATDMDGHFKLTLTSKPDSIAVSSVGYHQQTLPLGAGNDLQVDFMMKSSTFQLSEVVIKPGENPAHVIIKKAIKNKKKNNPKRISAYRSKLYSKASIGIQNFDKRYADKKFMNQFAFVFETEPGDSVRDFPLFFSESLAHVSHQKSPFVNETKVVNSSSSGVGVDNDDVKEYMSVLDIEINPYQNFIPLFSKNFISPLNDLGLASYRYYLTDSAYIDGTWCHKLTFKPRRRKELTFKGHMWIDHQTAAIKSIDATVCEGANLNFVSKLIFDLKYNKTKEGPWILTQQSIDINFKVVENQIRKKKEQLVFHAQKLNFFHDIEIGAFSAEASSVADAPEIVNATEYFDNNRPVVLTANELETRELIDTLGSLSMITALKKLSHTFMTGYYPLGRIEVGPYFNLVSYNPVEGTRYNFAFRTGKSFSKKYYYQGNFGYGTRDKKWKYDLNAICMLDAKTHTKVSVHIDDDLEILGRGLKQSFFRENKLSTDENNIISSILRRRPNNKLLQIRSQEVSIGRDWKHGFRTELVVNHRRFSGLAYRPLLEGMEIQNRLNEQAGFETYEITMTNRISFKERIVDSHFRRMYLGSRYPILYGTITVGKHTSNGGGQYVKPGIIVKQKLKMGRFGSLHYLVDAGMVMGAVPYPLLEIHAANETFSYYRYAGNLLNYAEFASDKYVNVYAEHHFGGMFLNKIPLLRKLDWREVVSGSAMMGSLSASNSSEPMKKLGVRGLADPYTEVGAGLENIFKVFRIEAIWRLNYLENTKAPKFGIRGRMQINF